MYYYKGTKDETRDDHISTPNPYGVPAGEIISNDDLVNEEVKNTAVFGSIEWDLAINGQHKRSFVGQRTIFGRQALRIWVL